MKNHSTNPRAQREARAKHATLDRIDKHERKLADKEHRMKAYLIASETRTQLLELLARIGDDDLAHPQDREAAVMIRPHLLTAPERFVADAPARERLSDALDRESHQRLARR